MSTPTTQELLKKQNEMITELIAVTKDCVQACRLVLQNGQIRELKREAQSMLNPQPSTFRRPYLPKDPKAEEAMKKAQCLFVHGRTRSQIAAELSIPYSTVCQLIRGYVGRHVAVQRRKRLPSIKPYAEKRFDIAPQ